MGNPSFNFGDGGPCWACDNFRGLRTQPDGMLLTLCAQGMPHTFKFVSGDPATGCRFWTELAPVDCGNDPAASRAGT